MCVRVCAHNGQNSGGQAQELIGALGSVRVLVHLCSSQQPEVPLPVFACTNTSTPAACLLARPGAPEEG